MERWEGKLAVVTGSSSGIGAAIATYLVENGMQVVGLARREDRLQDLAMQLEDRKGKFHPLKADLSQENEILEAFDWIENHFGGIHVFVNNAGVLEQLSHVTESDIDKVRKVFDINVVALTICSREAVKSMKAHNIDDGYIINISSVVAHNSPFPGYTAYTASKHAVQAISEGMRVELALENSNIKITTICPGVVSTEVFEAAQISVPSTLLSMQSEDVAETVIYCLQMPKSAQITDLVIEPTGASIYKMYMNFVSQNI